MVVTGVRIMMGMKKSGEVPTSMLVNPSLATPTIVNDAVLTVTCLPSTVGSSWKRLRQKR
jgi:hypothetical protein